MTSEAAQLHFVMFPYMAQGHMIPMMDTAKLLLQRNVIVTVITTPQNAARFKSTFARYIESGYPFRLIQLQFPCKEAGLPEGCENCDMLPSLGRANSFWAATSYLREPVERVFEELTPPPSCIIADLCLPYTRDISRKFNVPLITFIGVGCFYLLCMHRLNTYNVIQSKIDETEYFVLPGVPHRIEVTKAQVVSSIGEGWEQFYEEVIASEMASYGVITNSFEDMEPAYVREYKKVRNNKVWCIGPVSLSNKDQLEKAQRGNNKTSIDDWQHLKWLDSQKPGTVIYACLGSLCNLLPQQVIELGLALEASKRPFIWVIREGTLLEALQKWIKEDGFEERTKARSLIIRGWAPQLLILSHPAIGGFITHCGWNSTTEAICAGVPMITWPLFGDQFLNEKLVVEILKVGVKVGVKSPVIWGKEEESSVLIRKEDVEKAIQELMDESYESKERRKGIRKLAEMAKEAVEEGGSSDYNVTLLIQDIMQITNGKDGLYLNLNN